MDVKKRRHDHIVKMEQRIERKIGKAVRKDPLGRALLQDVKGMGEMMAAVVLTEWDT